MNREELLDLIYDIAAATIGPRDGTDSEVAHAAAKLLEFIDQALEEAYTNGQNNMQEAYND